MHTVNYCRLLLLSYIRPACKAEIPPCTSTTRLSRGGIHQRGRARHAAHGMALSRCGSAYQAPPLFLCWESVVSASGESGVPLSPNTQCLGSLAHRHQRPAGAAWTPFPAARPCVAASRCAWCQRHITALPCSMLCSLSQWARRRSAMPRHHQAVAWSAWQLWCTPAAATRFALT